MFSAFVIVYLFLGGFGAGMLFLASSTSLAFHLSLERTEQETAAFDAWRNRCLLWGFVIVAMGALCLLLDLGRPERFVMLLLHPSPTSVLSYGTVFLSVLLACSGLLVVANYCDGALHTTAAVRKALEVLCAFFSIAVMAYTGVYLMVTNAVAFWSTPLLVALFIASALSMGLSGCGLAGALLRDTWVLDGITRKSHWAHAVIVALEACLLFAFVAQRLAAGGRAYDSCMLLFSGDLEVWFFGGVVLCGLVVPLLREICHIALRPAASFPVSDVLCILGGLSLRLCLVSAGLH